MERLKTIRACWAKNASSTGADIRYLIDLIDKQAEQIKAKDEAIEAALRIKTLWLCPTPGDGPEVEEECRALAAMAVRLEQALKGEPCKSEQ